MDEPTKDRMMIQARVTRLLLEGTDKKFKVGDRVALRADSIHRKWAKEKRKGNVPRAGCQGVISSSEPWNTVFEWDSTNREHVKLEYTVMFESGHSHGARAVDLDLIKPVEEDK